MPRTIATIRKTVRRAGRSMSFQRPAFPERPIAPDTPVDRSSISDPPRRSLLRGSRSFPNLARLVERKGPIHSSTLDPSQLHADPTAVAAAAAPPTTGAAASTHASPLHPPPSRPPSVTSTSSTITTDASMSMPAPAAPPASTSFISRPSPRSEAAENTLPAPAKPFLRRISSSQRLRRLSLGQRSRMTRSTSFGDGATRAWSMGGGGSSRSLLSPRHNTDDALWDRLRRRESRLRKMRNGAYEGRDFEGTDESIVEMGTRLPDRSNPLTQEDVFGRRRGDFARLLDDGLEASKLSVLAGEVDRRKSIAGSADEKESVLQQDLKNFLGVEDADVTPGDVGPEGKEEEETIRSITKAIESSKGRLRQSANMSRAFRAVIKSGEGLVRKRELIEATLNSNGSKDPSMIILLDPETCDSSNLQLEGVSSTSDETGSVETIASGNVVQSVASSASATIGFSTSMTAKQCAATLETLLREMACRVSRYPDLDEGARQVVRLRVMRWTPGGKRADRKVKVMVTIREEDHIRTSVSFKKIRGLYSSRDSHVPLCTSIRDRFRREWPKYVEALYIRLPNAAASHIM